MPNGTPRWRQKEISSSAVSSACLSDASRVSSAWRRSFSIQRGTVDAEPAEEPQGLHRSAHRKGEHDRDRIEVAVATLVGIVGDQILGCVDVVDDLGDEVGAAGLLLGDQPEVLVVFASVPLGYRDGAEEQVGSRPRHGVAVPCGASWQHASRVREHRRRRPFVGRCPATRSNRGVHPRCTSPSRDRPRPACARSRDASPDSRPGPWSAGTETAAPRGCGRPHHRCRRGSGRRDRGAPGVRRWRRRSPGPPPGWLTT